MFFSAANMVAGAAAPDKPRSTPGAKATQQAVRKATQANGTHGNGQGDNNGQDNNGQDQDNEGNDDAGGNGKANGNGNGPKSTPGAKATEKADARATKGQGNKHGQRITYRGIVSAVGGDSLTLTLPGGGSQTFAVNSDTRIHVPTLGPSASLADVNVGVQAMVQVLANDASHTAVYITVVPGKPAPVHRVGVVTAYTPGASITVQDKNGESSTFLLTPDTKILPAERASQLGVGSRVTIISRRDPTGGPLTAQGIVVHPATGEATTTPEASATATATAAVSDTPTATPTATDTPTETPTVEPSATSTETATPE